MPDTKLSIDTAIPLGLLINETVTNSLKYGFVEKQEGQIDISLIKTQQPNTFILKIADNGIGFSEDLDHRTTNSLGLKLIHNLARQLKGSVERANDEKGTTYTVHFQEIEK
jgi:two-component sensor histidine kinase